MDWSTCPSDIIFLIFEKLDNKSLLTCLSICQLWRNVAYHMIQTKNLWQSIAEDYLFNKAICYKLKSTLTWQEICLNSLLWFNLSTMKVQLDKNWNLKRKNIRALHMFKDKIIVIYDTVAEYFNVETSARIVKKPTVSDCQETEHITITLIGNDLGISFKHNSTRYTPACNFYKLADDRCFVIDSNNKLWRYKCCGRGYGLRFIMRTYTGPDTILRMNVYDQEVYILTKKGDILNVSEWGIQFNLVCILERIDYIKSSVVVMFLRHSFIYNVPLRKGKEAKTVYQMGQTEEVMIACPGMTCATPHGDLLLVGYEDGAVEICYPQKILSGDSKYVKFNIKDHVEDTLENPSILALEMYEAKGAHYLFVATQCNLFKLLLNHEDSNYLYDIFNNSNHSNLTF